MEGAYTGAHLESELERSLEPEEREPPEMVRQMSKEPGPQVRRTFLSPTHFLIQH
jgi:hypothetical protein